MQRTRQSTRPALLTVIGFVAALLTSAPLAADDGFKPIFNGKDLAGWDGNTDFWSVEDGAITGRTTPEKPTKGNTFIVWRAGELDDFELELEYKIVGGNSGIQYRSFERPDEWGKWVIGGYQGDFEAGNRYSGILYGERYRGILGDRGQKTVIGADHKPKVVGSVGDSKEIQTKIKKEDWNAYRIVARGHHFQHFINGVQTVDVVDEDTEMRRRTGLLALQLHQGPPMTVQFRNIRLKRLPLGDAKKVVFVAGRRSHGYGAHEHYAGCMLLKSALDANAPGIVSTVYRGGWPYAVDGLGREVEHSDVTAFDNADAIVIYCDGGGGHPFNSNLETIDALAKKGVGIGCLHYGVETPVQLGNGKPSGQYFLDWIGGYFRTKKSVNPHWTLEKTVIGDHPVGNGVKPFFINDEWYFNMQFRDGMKGVTPVLTATPPESTMSRPDGDHSGNPEVRELVKNKTPMHLVWVSENEGGGRGFGCTGGHVHWNWKNDDFRKLILNAVAWIAKAEVPENGIESATPSQEELEANQDYPKPGERRRQRD